MPHLNTLVSQYETLLSLCKNLSSADIAHLAATCKESWTAITGSKPTHERLQRDAICSGKGIAAQARLFGYHKEGTGNPDWPCLGEDAKPCTECKAKVCNNCRFHTLYRSILQEMNWEEDDNRSLTQEQWCNAEEFENSEVFCPNDCVFGACEEYGDHLTGDFGRLDIPEHNIAWRIFHEQRPITKCNTCEPLELYRDQSSKDRECACDLYEHLVGERWLCIPCVEAEEAKSASCGSKVMVHDDYGYVACECGKPSERIAVALCRICQRFMTFIHQYDPDHYAFKDDIQIFDRRILVKILAQLGGTVISQSEDPILGQLG